jgi:hypothetical protein
LYAIANAVEFCFTSFSGGLHIEFNQQLMRDHLIACLEKGQFSVFPKVKVSKKGKVMCKSSVVESNCKCGKADSIENMMGCDWKSGVIVCSVWRHSSCAGGVVKSNWFCSKHKVTVI